MIPVGEMQGMAVDRRGSISCWQRLNLPELMINRNTGKEVES